MAISKASELVNENAAGPKIRDQVAEAVDIQNAPSPRVRVQFFGFQSVKFLPIEDFGPDFRRRGLPGSNRRSHRRENVTTVKRGRNLRAHQFAAGNLKAPGCPVGFGDHAEDAIIRTDEDLPSRLQKNWPTSGTYARIYHYDVNSTRREAGCRLTDRVRTRKKRKCGDLMSNVNDRRGRIDAQNHTFHRRNVVILKPEIRRKCDDRVLRPA